ncbi:MAG: hypothetical protein ABIB71_01665 [Candidatus Woesearchaeota archaeon]
MLSRLISDIVAKRELKDIDRALVEDLVKDYVSSHPLKDLPYSQLKRTKEYKLAVKEIRRVLREVYGVFKLKGFDKREEILERLKGLDDVECHEALLKLHKSTAERLEFYPEVYSAILNVAGEVKSVLDLGCGLNPVSYPFMNRKVKYLAAELSEKDSAFIQKYFDKAGVDGKAFALNLLEVKELPSADICFMFKLPDTLESLKRGVTKELLGKIKCKWLVVSFSTKSLGGRKSISKKRLVWFEKLIKDKSYETFEIENEFFYIIKN